MNQDHSVIAEWSSTALEKILSKPKQSHNKKIAWVLAGLAIAWYLISMFTMWK